MTMTEVNEIQSLKIRMKFNWRKETFDMFVNSPGLFGSMH